MDQETAPIPVPYADEAAPGLGRRSGVPEEERRQSGGLSDESPEDPVRDSIPFGSLSGGR